MEALSPFHLIIILAVIVLLFGGKKIPEVMRGLGEGIRNFKDGMNSPHPTSPSANPPANPPAAAPTAPPPSTRKKRSSRATVSCAKLQARDSFKRFPDGGSDLRDRRFLFARRDS